MFLKALKPISAALLLALSGLASAVTQAESGDAGFLPGSAQALPSGVTGVTGTNSTTDVDMFGFSWGGGALTLDAASSVGGDLMLFLFDAAGLGIAANDDRDANTLNARISFASLGAGQYFLAAGICCTQPTSATGLIFPYVFSVGQASPTGPGGGSPVTGWTATADEPGAVAYQISFSGAIRERTSVPLPTTAVLLGLGLAGLAAKRRRQQA
ncbi:MAG TPA: DVUA0089 family protein [Burkholderiaceae bacterium]|jgi:hypothetical protein|nr:DVUA0089 family protein [Burkholderiaceae bacterium]